VVVDPVDVEVVVRTDVVLVEVDVVPVVVVVGRLVEVDEAVVTGAVVDCAVVGAAVVDVARVVDGLVVVGLVVVGLVVVGRAVVEATDVVVPGVVVGGPVEVEVTVEVEVEVEVEVRLVWSELDVVDEGVVGGSELSGGGAEVDGASRASVGAVETVTEIVGPDGGRLGGPPGSSTSWAVRMAGRATVASRARSTWNNRGSAITRARGTTVVGLPNSRPGPSGRSRGRRRQVETGLAGATSAGCGPGRRDEGWVGRFVGGGEMACAESDPADGRRDRSAGSGFLGSRRPGGSPSDDSATRPPLSGPASGSMTQAGTRPSRRVRCSRHFLRPRWAICRTALASLSRRFAISP